MDSKLQSILDELDVTQASELFESGNKINVSLNRRTALHIKSSVFESVYIKKPRRIFAPRRAAAFAAVFIVVAALIIAFNPGQIANAIHRLFNLIPGVGITEDNNDVTYTLAAQTSSNSDGYTITITNALAGKNYVTVSFVYGATDKTDDDTLPPKQAIPDGAPPVSLILDGKSYKPGNWLDGVGEQTSVSATFNVDSKDINEQSKLTIVFMGNKCDFSLTPIKSFDSLSQIGPTQEHNNIWLTATSTTDNGRLRVELYPINKTGYTLVGFNGTFKDYFGKALHLETDKGDKPCTIPNNWGNAYCYDFDVGDGAKNLVLKVPFVIVQSSETKSLSLPIPKEGEVKQINRQIKLKDGSVTITSVEQTSSTDVGRALKLNLKYQSAHENQQLVGIEFDRAGYGSNTQSSSYSVETDSDGRISAIYYGLDKGENSTLKVKALKAQYVFTDEYDLTLDEK